MNILPISVHIHNRREVAEISSVIRSWGGVVGCRDLPTLEFLRKLGFHAYFSSCLTTTLFYKFGRMPYSERSGVVFCDVNFGSVFPLRDYFLRSRIKRVCGEILSSYKTDPIYTVTHSCSVLKTHEERFRLAEDLLSLYSKAKLVITSRIHCALPCIAMGTPVILVVNHYDDKRYPGIDGFLNKIYCSSAGKFVVDVNMKSGFVLNNDKHIPYAEKLIEQCEAFVGMGV